MQMNRLLCTAILSGTICVGMSASAPDSLQIAIADRLSCFSDMAEYGYVSNPALQFFRKWDSMSDIRVGWDYGYSPRAIVSQNGRGHSLASFDAGSYFRFSESTAVYGSASYHNGSYRDIKWNNTADYTLLRPYVLGDSVGGDISSQLYAFNGGYAGSSGDWSWGVEFGYRAELNYRNRDPRLKVIVSDLDLKAGVTHRISSGYVAGLSAGLRIYNQESDLEFYNPLNSILTYALTGLGTFYQRFSGNSNENAAYKFVGFNAGLQVYTIDEEGLSISVDYDRYDVGQVLRDYNNLTLTNLVSHRLSTDIAVIRKFDSVRGGLEIKGWWNRRLGTENLFGSPAGNNYKKISSRTFYYNDVIDLHASLPVEWTVIPGTSLSVIPAVGFRYDHENYRRPSRDTEWRSLTPSLTVGYLGCPSGKWIVSSRLTGTYVNTVPMNCRLTGLDQSLAIGEMVTSNYTMATTDSKAVAIDVEVAREVSPAVAVYVSGSYCREWFSGVMVSDHTSLNIGVKF